MRKDKMTTTQVPLADQIEEFMPKVVDALGSSNLEIVEATLALAETLLKSAREEAERCAKSVINPLSSRAELTAAQKFSDLVNQDVDRVMYAKDQLQEREALLLEINLRNFQVSRYNSARSERDRVAIKIQEEYPEIQNRLKLLLSDIAQANSLCDDVNSDLPEGLEPLRPGTSRRRASVGLVWRTGVGVSGRDCSHH
ncbi:hypothetical protein [Ruegeria atlantica]|uniref:hypothetical protein n=1 Tax=Ruegeria atlantica TaxID=81569 RepID=UPI00147BEB9D|nr:hypothetical protein [Ruegeria atlantica]